MMYFYSRKLDVRKPIAAHILITECSFANETSHLNIMLEKFRELMRSDSASLSTPLYSNILLNVSHITWQCSIATSHCSPCHKDMNQINKRRSVSVMLPLCGPYISPTCATSFESCEKMCTVMVLNCKQFDCS